jgi:hypothetical protein
MPDYKELYLKLFRASERAVDLLIAAQRECEERYVSSPESDVPPVPLPAEHKKRADDE